MLLNVLGGEASRVITGPSVTVNKASGQADPTSTSPILFDIVFSEPVTNFIAIDLNYTGTTAGGTMVGVLGGGPTTWTASISGMTTAGNVALNVPAGAVNSIATGAPNTVSTSTDNVVAWTVPAGAWYTLYNATLPTDNNGWSGYIMRQYIAPAAYGGSVPATGTKLRLTLAAGPAGAIGQALYAAHKAPTGDVIDYDGGQVQIQVSGSNSFTMAGNATQLTDERAFAFDKTKGLVLAVRLTGSSDVKSNTPLTNFQGAWQLNNLGDDSYASVSNVNVTGTGDVTGVGGFDLASRCYFFIKVEVFG